MNEKLILAAKEFTEKAKKHPSLLESVVVGSVAGDDPYPKDLDLAIVVRNCDDIKILAKYARQMSKYTHNWEVFLFDEELNHLNRICHRKECPTTSVDCLVPGCGKILHIRVHADFTYNEKKFLTSPIKVLWTSFETSRFLQRKSELGITETRTYPVLKNIQLECIICGKEFIFTGAQRKWYQSRGLHQPKQCPDCIERKRFEGFRD